MFCSSLRERTDWASVPTTLLSSQNPKWREKALETHDLELRLPQPHGKEQECFRLLLLSASDLASSSPSMDRIERLYHQTGGRQVGIVFLLGKQGDLGNGTAALMTLQASLPANLEMPIIPLSSVKSLQAALFAFHRQLMQTRSVPVPVPSTSEKSILPFCSANGLLSEHTSNVLSDVVNGLPQLATAATTPDGQRYLKRYFLSPDPEVYNSIVEFWHNEYLME